MGFLPNDYFKQGASTKTSYKFNQNHWSGKGGTALFWIGKKSCNAGRKQKTWYDY